MLIFKIIHLGTDLFHSWEMLKRWLKKSSHKQLSWSWNVRRIHESWKTQMCHNLEFCLNSTQGSSRAQTVQKLGYSAGSQPPPPENTLSQGCSFALFCRRENPSTRLSNYKVILKWLIGLFFPPYFSFLGGFLRPYRSQTQLHRLLREF